MMAEKKDGSKEQVKVYISWETGWTREERCREERAGGKDQRYPQAPTKSIGEENERDDRR